MKKILIACLIAIPILLCGCAIDSEVPENASRGFVYSEGDIEYIEIPRYSPSYSDNYTIWIPKSDVISITNDGTNLKITVRGRSPLP